MPRKWKTVRVVVEVSVLGDYSENDLVWDVRHAFANSTESLDRKVIREGVQTGLIQVKQMNKVLAAAIRQQVDKRTTSIESELNKVAAVKTALAKNGLL
jgi:hypothetical protein